MTAPEQDLADEVAAKVVAALSGPADRQLLTLEGAATQMGITTRLLWTITHVEKAIPVIVVGKGGHRIRQSDIDAYVASKVQEED